MFHDFLFSIILIGDSIRANESEMQLLIKPCNLLQTQPKLNEKLEFYRYFYSRELKAMQGSV